MKIITTKEDPMIREDEFEVWDYGKCLTLGGRFMHVNCKMRKQSINFVFDDSIKKEKLMECVSLMYDTFMVKKKRNI